MRKALFAVLSVFGLAAVSSAQLAPTPPFTGLYNEEFDAGLPGYRTLDNTASIAPSPGGQMMITYGWLVYVGYSVYPRGQSNSFLGTVVGHAVLTFDTPVQRFGAWFATVGYLPGGYARIYDDGNNLLATEPLAAPRGGPWVWDGWDAGPNGPKMKRIEFFANDPYNGGALLCIEDAECDISLGTVSTRPTGCGGLGIAVAGLPVVGDTMTFSLAGSGGFAGFVVGASDDAPIGPCSGCTLGVSGVSVVGTSFLLDIPNSPVFLDLAISAQGFRLGAGPCLGMLQLSDTLDVRIGESP
jgi:hypothetical protein